MNSISRENFENFNLANTSYLNLPVIEYEDKCDQFRVEEKTFQTQYFPYYNARAELMGQMVEEKAKIEWGADVKFFELNQLNDTTEEERVCLVGVIFKYLEKHPSILKEVSEEYQVWTLHWPGSDQTRSSMVTVRHPFKPLLTHSIVRTADSTDRR